MRSWQPPLSSSLLGCRRVSTLLLLGAPATTQHLSVFMFLLLFLAPCWLGLRQPLGNSMKPTERGEELVVSTDASSYSVQTHLTSRKPAHQYHSSWIMDDFQAVLVFFFLSWCGGLGMRAQVKQIKDSHYIEFDTIQASTVDSKMLGTKKK